MSAESMAISLKKPKSYKAILWGGLIAGILDITAAFVNSSLRGGSPIRMLQAIASGVLGAESYKGGLKSATLGLALHFFIAFVATAVYYVASRKLRFLVQWGIVSGLLYGVAVYLVMYHIVLPLVFTSRNPNSIGSVITSVIIHMLFVGLPISLIIRRYSK
jgi:hypothetical protein